jgi:hypothetical protein
MRMDSGFWSAKTIRACRRHQIRYSITVRQTTPIRAAIQAIDEQAWVEIVYPDGGLAQVAETHYQGDQGDRLIVRRTRLVGAQAEQFPNVRDHAFVTDRLGTAIWLDQDHRRHAVVELCIRDLKAGVGLRHCPSGKFNANAAWLLACGCRLFGSRHATCAYSWISPPSRSRRTTLPAGRTAADSPGPSGGTCPKARCGRCTL